MKKKIVTLVVLIVMGLLLSACEEGMFGSIDKIREQAIEENSPPDTRPTYTVQITMSGNAGEDSVTITPHEAKHGDAITINYTLDELDEINLLVFSVGTAVIAPVNYAGSGTRTYVLNASDEEDGFITITAAFTHAEVVTIYDVKIVMEGKEGSDSVTVTPDEGAHGSTITINYTVADTKTKNELSFSGTIVGIDPVNSAETDTRTYTLNAADAVDGVITITATFTHTAINVYVAGYYEEGGVTQACYWVDGGDPVPLNGHEAKAITVAAGKVYVAGTYGTSYPYSGCYWVDGIRNALLGSTSDPVAIVVSNGDVYTAGMISGYPGYWKNGTQHPIYDNSGDDVCGMAVSGDDVYVLGTTNDGKTRICYWKNGASTPVTFLKDYQDENEYSSSWACDIAISNNIIYVAGYLHRGTNNSYFYWKENGEPTFLSSEAGAVYGINAITVSKDKIYVAGDLRYGNIYFGGYSYYPCYWVDGEDTVYTDGNSAESIDVSIAVLDDIVYMAGTYNDGEETKACYWVNGERFVLPGGTGESKANAIVVVYE